MPFSHSYLKVTYFSQFTTQVYVQCYAQKDWALNTNAMYENFQVIIEY